MEYDIWNRYFRILYLMSMQYDFHGGIKIYIKF